MPRPELLIIDIEAWKAKKIKRKKNFPMSARSAEAIPGITNSTSNSNVSAAKWRVIKIVMPRSIKIGIKMVSGAIRVRKDTAKAETKNNKDLLRDIPVLTANLHLEFWSSFPVRSGCTSFVPLLHLEFTLYLTLHWLFRLRLLRAR